MSKVTLLGTIGADVKVGSVGEGRFALNFSVAENIPIKNSKSEVVYVPQWFSVAFFSNSDKMAKHLLKGKKVFVSGNLRFSEFKNEKTGDVIKTNEIIADTVEPVEWVKSEEFVQNNTAQNASANALPPMPDDLPDDFNI